MPHRDDRDRERFHGSYDPEHEMPNPDRHRGDRYESDAYRHNARDSRYDPERGGFFGRMRNAVDRVVDRFSDRDTEDSREWARRNRNRMPDRADAYTRGSSFHVDDTFRDRDYDYDSGYSGRTMRADENTYAGDPDRNRYDEYGNFARSSGYDRGAEERWSSMERERGNRGDEWAHRNRDYDRSRFSGDDDRMRYEMDSRNRGDRDQNDGDRSLWRSSSRPDYLGRNATPWQQDDRYGRHHEEWSPNRDNSDRERERNDRDRWESRDRGNYGYDRDRDDEWRDRDERFNPNPYDRDRYRR